MYLKENWQLWFRNPKDEDNIPYCFLSKFVTKYDRSLRKANVYGGQIIVVKARQIEIRVRKKQCIIFSNCLCIPLVRSVYHFVSFLPTITTFWCISSSTCISEQYKLNFFKIRVSLYPSYPHNLHFLIILLMSISLESFSNPLLWVALGFYTE